MSGLLIDEIKYIGIMVNNELKKKSLNDNVYFNLRDIFWNSMSADIVFKANNFNDKLSGGILYEYRSDNFNYTNVLYQDKNYVNKLLKWLKKIEIHHFDFLEPDVDEEIDMKNYMKFDDWWVQFNNLTNLIEMQYHKLCKWEVEDLERDCGQVDELSDDEI
jgi:hypothetical protein